MYEKNHKLRLVMLVRYFDKLLCLFLIWLPRAENIKNRIHKHIHIHIAVYSIRTDRILHSCTVSRDLMASVNKKNGSVNLIKK